MTSKSCTDTDRWPGARIDYATFAEQLARRRAETGEPDLPRNKGNNRTQSKRALLQAIKDIGGNW